MNVNDLPTESLSRRSFLRIAGLVAAGGVAGSIAAPELAGAVTRTTKKKTTSKTTATTVAKAAATTTTVRALTDAANVSVIPSETGGPFPGDGSNGANVLTQNGVVRRDIRSSFGSSTTTAEGIPLTLNMSVRSASTGKALAGAAIYIWHCDAVGRYSMYTQDIVGENYLRGVQEVDANGLVTFTTIFPGCYQGRWPHIHFEIYPSIAKATGKSNAVKTSQLAFPDDVCAKVYASSLYAGSTANLSRLSLASDNVFSDGWSSQLATVTGDATKSLTAALTFAV
jgi:protocatechuate 3,4-dioxygenase beta subunit